MALVVSQSEEETMTLSKGNITCCHGDKLYGYLFPW